MVCWQMKIILATLLVGDHAAPVDNVHECRTEYVTTWETQYHETEEEECTNILKKVPVMISKLEPKKICEEIEEDTIKTSVQEVVEPFTEHDIKFSCHTEHVKIWKHSHVELISKECKTVTKKIPVEVSKMETKKDCDEVIDPFDEAIDSFDEAIDPFDEAIDPFDESYYDYETSDDDNENEVRIALIDPSDETNFDYDTSDNANENEVGIALNDNDEPEQKYPPIPAKLPCWSGTECPSDLITVATR